MEKILRQYEGLMVSLMALGALILGFVVAAGMLDNVARVVWDWYPYPH